MSAVTFSKRFGYMEKDCDFDGTLRIADQSINYLGYVGQMPWLDFYLDKNPIIRLGPPNLSTATRIAAESLFPRLEGIDPNYNPKQPDFLQSSYSSARAIPYLEAVARETMRMHPAISMAMERIVPKEGLVLPDGSVVPTGTLVGMNPYILGRNKEVYGTDADEFIPDRWLQQDGETDEKYQLRMRLWNAADLTFGSGLRICLGRNISQMEIYKVVATVIMRFEMEWFHRVDGGLTCRLKRRTERT
ncbi:cytochrome P450 [Pseudomassariella vexata]|uniref:Cytochrome P450 n=1 Tax=Pseudomassariella vexata TaxID=1141098 RepID=A0A1Y2E9F6_9PEZI|nr:cytochrome P450 [Pseudomassariella vexata]ORY68203.1 cytochrome P450 [Pseudomassariella vexata]